MKRWASFVPKILILNQFAKSNFHFQIDGKEWKASTLSFREQTSGMMQCSSPWADEMKRLETMKSICRFLCASSSSLPHFYYQFSNFRCSQPLTHLVRDPHTPTLLWCQTTVLSDSHSKSHAKSIATMSPHISISACTHIVSVQQFEGINWNEWLLIVFFSGCRRSFKRTLLPLSSSSKLISDNSIFTWANIIQSTRPTAAVFRSQMILFAISICRCFSWALFSERGSGSL